MKMTVKQAAEKYPFFTENILRWHLFHRETNGLAPAVFKVGKRVLIDEARFLEWVESHAGS